MKRVNSILATIGLIIFLIGAACADSDSIAPTIVLMSIGSIVTGISLIGMAGDRNDYRA